MSQPNIVEGGLVVPPGSSVAIVASRFNHFIVDRLVDGAVDAFVRHGGDASKITIVKVPGAWEIPVVDAVVALGAVIRGSTPTSTTWPARSPRAWRRCRWRRASR
jgi:6,7-dimethyl-8-ribityllumazine synthase